MSTEITTTYRVMAGEYMAEAEVTTSFESGKTSMEVPASTLYDAMANALLKVHKIAFGGGAKPEVGQVTDSWERLEDDALDTTCDCQHGPYGCSYDKDRDLVRRARALAGRDA